MTEVDPYAMPLPACLFLMFFVVSLTYYWKMTGRFRSSPRNDQLFHGLLMTVVALVGGLFIPHAPRTRSMLTFHAVGLLQAMSLLAFGGIWSLIYGDETRGKIAAWCNILGFWFNLLGIVYSAITGAQCLLYYTKHSNPQVHAIGSIAETFLEIVLKGQGLLNLLGVMFMLHEFLKKEKQI